MRVELTKDDAAVVRAALTSLHEGDAHPRAERAGSLRAIFEVPERVAAEVREHVYPYMVRTEGEAVGPEYADEDKARADAEAWTARWANIAGVARRYEVVNVDPPRREHLLTCPKCGGTTIGYAENCVDYRTPSGQTVRDDGGGEVAVYWSSDGTGESGDSDPGLFCDNWEGGGCGVPIDLPDGWEVDYQ